jgi:glycosyltransferase involved in cell wall biosynthesis
MRVLILSHGHPELGAGGAERAAYSLFKRLKEDPEVESALFVARAPSQAIGHSARFGSFRGRPDEILVDPPPVDGFTFQSLDHDTLVRLLRDVIRRFRPTVVHVHHFLFWGIDIFELLKEESIRVVLTLHEYSAICANYGQMLKRDGTLCYAASPAECSMCIRDLTAGKFFVRQKIIARAFRHVDCFISPSEFLRGRMLDWGLTEDKIQVIENVLDEKLLQVALKATDQSPVQNKDRLLVFGFFGQVTPYKGVDLLLTACGLLPSTIRRAIEVRVYGENIHYRDTDFGTKVSKSFEKTKDFVREMGAYRNADGLDLMRSCDWIIVPSVWWENSPIVIQEAKLARKPLIYAKAGGMEEKATAGLDLAFPIGSSAGLADAIRLAVSSRAVSKETELRKVAETRLEIEPQLYKSVLQIYQS